MSTTVKREIRVFIASPGDLAIERRAFKDVIDELNRGFGSGCDVEFKALGWEETLSGVGRRPQDVINKDIDSCDVFVLAMFRRWGQRAPDAKKRGFSSYTEEEFYRALRRLEKTKCPTIFAFFKYIDTGEMASPGADLKKVLKFRKKLEQSKQVLWRGFKDEGGFKDEIDKHLRAFAKGETELPTEPIAETLLPDSAIAEMKKLRQKANRETERAEKAEKKAKAAMAKLAAAERSAEARIAQKSIILAESAAKAALEGKIEEARQDFAKALDGTTNIEVLDLGAQFFKRIGELDEAERLLRRWLSLCGPDTESTHTAAAYGKLGLLERGRGNLDAAEAYHKRSLVIEEKLGQQDGMAKQYNNLGLIEQERKNLDAAEAYHNKALAINEKLGRQEGIATVYGNLGVIEQSRGNLDAAEAYHNKSLAINEKLGRQEGIASGYGNLGPIESARGNLDAAETHLKKSMAINEKLGRREGMALNYTNLGLIAKQRGKKDEARRLWTLARDLFQKIGHKARATQVQAWLDGTS